MYIYRLCFVNCNTKQRMQPVISPCLLSAVHVCAVFNALHHALKPPATRLPTSRAAERIEWKTWRVGDVITERAERSRGERSSKVGEDGGEDGWVGRRRRGAAGESSTSVMCNVRAHTTNNAPPSRAGVITCPMYHQVKTRSHCKTFKKSDNHGVLFVSWKVGEKLLKLQLWEELIKLKVCSVHFLRNFIYWNIFVRANVLTYAVRYWRQAEF